MSGRVIRVAPRRVREPASVQNADTLHPDVVVNLAVPTSPAPQPAPDIAPPAPAAVAPVVTVDNTEILKQLSANNALLHEILGELRRKKKWNFDLVRDALGRPSEINATEN